MTALFMVCDYGFTLIELFLFFIILKAIYSDINYKYAVIISIISALCTTLINQISLFSAYSVILFVLSTFIGGCILIRKDYFMLLSISAFYVLMMGCYEFCYVSLIMHFSSYGADYLTLILDYGWRRFVFSLTTKCGQIIAVLLVCAVIRRIAKEKFYVWKLAIVTVLGYISILYMVHSTFQNYTTTTSKLWMVFAAFLLLLFFILLFEIDLRSRRHLQEKEALSKHLLEEKYQNITAMFNQNAMLYHDIRNHLYTLYHLLEENRVSDAKEYIENIQKPIQLLKKTSWTDNDVVDAVLNDKIQLMENQGIRYDIQAEFPYNTGIEDADICTILANLLDNAIKATAQLPEQTTPVGIRIQSIKKFVIIEIRNPSPKVEFTNDGMPKRANKSAFHGWGLHNVAQAVEKYDGALQFNYKDGIFAASAMLFFPQKAGNKSEDHS